MTGLLHALHVATLATWLSFSGFGYVGLGLYGGHKRTIVREPEPFGEEGFELSLDSMPEGGESARDGEEDVPADEEAASPEEEVAEELEAIEAPPELADLPETLPLPDLPDLPPLPQPAAEPRPQASERRPTPPRRSSNTGSATGTRRSGTPGGTGTASQGSGAGGGSGTGAGMSQGQRLAGGLRPPPYYPASSKRAGEEGQVVIALTIGSTGHVTSARIVRPCPYAALNESALNAVRRWKFKPGPTVTTTQTVTFRLK